MMLITDLEFIARQAAEKADDYEAFRYYIELDERSDEALDELVEQIATPIIAAIDCTTCANCCRHLDVYLTEADAQRLSSGTFIPYSTLLHQYIDREHAAQVEEWGMFQQKPCVFLKDTLCSIYEYRPESCRIYPMFTPDFRWTLEDTFGGIGLCPIIYNVIEQLKIQLGW
ncbi:MAG: hypothetical protein CUN55_03310 [Phototrophicales bacterium]|nr:MAG: hypothetical protein CUN55_03310 [Phototrophicales bacterium]